MNQTIYDNSKDALAYIMREYGAEVLLGKRLRNFFLDFARVKESRKNVVFLVIESGAAETLKKGIGAKAEEQELAYREAVQRLIRKYPIERGEVESVMLEFTAALGWRINVQPQTQPEPQQPQQRQAAPPQTQPAPVQPKPAQQMKSALPELIPGQRNVQFGKYLWRVLDVKDNRALLLTEEILERRRYHSKVTSVTWKACELRKYLNGAFLQSFSGQEQERIAKTENRNADNQWYGTSGGRDTVDKVFLLSIDEVVKYFGDSGQLWKRPAKDEWWINDEYSSARIAKYQGKGALWWLRSPGNDGSHAAFVFDNGSLYMTGCFLVGFETGGVRPALWLKL